MKMCYSSRIVISGSITNKLFSKLNNLSLRYVVFIRPYKIEQCSCAKKESRIDLLFVETFWVNKQEIGNNG